MSVTLSVVFDRPHATYFAGETVSGRVTARLSHPKTLRGIKFDLNGAANVRWTESESTGTGRRGSRRSVTYSAHENYFEMATYFVGGATGEVSLAPGEYAYDFKYVLPATLPSSFEGQFGYIRYTARVTMQRPWKFDHTAKFAFTVIAPLDLNLHPQWRTPIEMESNKTTCCWWCRSGPLSVNVRLPAGGFVPGETILVQIQIDNASTSEVRKVYFTLKKDVLWQANRLGGRGKTRTTSTPVIEVAFDEGVPAHGSKALSQLMCVPPLPPSNVLSQSRHINVQYSLEVTLYIPGCHGNLEAKTDILIGTVPFAASPTPVGTPTADPSAPPYYNDIPPPSYETCVFKGNNIMDGEGDNEFTMGTRDFTPRYPVYNFQPKSA